MPELEVVGDARCIEQITGYFESLPRAPDVVLTGTTVGGKSTILSLSAIRRGIWPSTRIVIFASRLNLSELPIIWQLGPAGYLLWSDLSRDVIRYCLTAILKRDLVVASQAAATAIVTTPTPSLTPQPLPNLGPREWDVLRLLAEGMTRREIAGVTAISLRSVERIVNELERKLDAPNLFVLAKEAARLGLIA
jgi:DNA-binding NarL/FixJ family response regulator